MWHRLYIQNSCNSIYTINMVCFRYTIVNTVHTGDAGMMIMDWLTMCIQ